MPKKRTPAAERRQEAQAAFPAPPPGALGITGRIPARWLARHAAVSLWLNSGGPATEVARRAGHGVAVLLKIYAHCIDGQADAANQRITDALGTTEAEQDPGDEGDAGSEPAA